MGNYVVFKIKIRKKLSKKYFRLFLRNKILWKLSLQIKEFIERGLSILLVWLI